MSQSSNELARFAGNYSGGGKWIDIARDSKEYRVTQQIEADGVNLRVHYVHEFFQEGSTTEGDFLFENASPLFTVHMKGAVVGNGYLFDNYLHYHLQVGPIFVQASYQLDGDGIRVFGSSTKNSQGRYIAWHESLKKVN